MNEINNKIKQYFEEIDIDIEEFFQPDPESVIEESSSDPVTKQILSKINDVASSNNAHKLLFAAAIFELRSQVKKNQEQTSETRRQMERGMKELQYTALNIEKKQESLLRQINALKDSLSSVLRVVSSRKTI